MQLVEVLGSGRDVAEDPNLMVIAIEFRLKPRVVANSGPDQGSTETESKAYKQLLQDCR